MPGNLYPVNTPRTRAPVKKKCDKSHLVPVSPIAVCSLLFDTSCQGGEGSTVQVRIPVGEFCLQLALPQLTTIALITTQNAQLTRVICSWLTPGYSFWQHDWHQTSPVQSPLGAKICLTWFNFGTISKICLKPKDLSLHRCHLKIWRKT